MGFDIDICTYIIKNNKAKRVMCHQETYLSYNWSNLSEICPKHLLEGKCPDDCVEPKNKLWYLRDDLHGRQGDDVAQRAEKAIDILKSYGIKIGIPDVTNPNWGWGNRNTSEKDKYGMPKVEDLPPKERLGVFVYHLDRFGTLGNQYPNCFFIADCCDKQLTLPTGTNVEYNNDSDNESDTYSSIPQPMHPITYVRHPFKGNFRVDSFKTAMEVYGLVAAQGDPWANSWYDLAFQMPDAPGK